MLRQHRQRCFYCNHPPRQQVRRGQSVWHCTHCEADNYLDQNGQITDPPATVASQASKAPSIQASAAPRQDILCATCIKHQQLIAASLAAYYPEDGDDAAYEAAEPAYRRRLEERWPPLCAQCEPRVQQSLRRANYRARADHAGRTLNRLRGSRETNTWRSTITTLGAVAWYTSWLVEILWHATAAPLHQIGPLCLLLGLFCVWWHPFMQRRKVKGLPQYYIVSTLGLLVRFWGIHRHKNHIWLGIFNICVFLLLHRLVRPRPATWITPIAESEPTGPVMVPQKEAAAPFSVASLASPERKRAPRLPTPPPEADYDDSSAMDWTPTRAFTPIKTEAFPSVDPTNQPRASVKKSRARDVNSRSTGHPLDLSSLGLSLEPSLDGVDDDSENDDTASLATRASSYGRRAAKAAFAMPRFFPDREQDTGLESLLASSFSLREEPDEVVQWSQNQADRRRHRGSKIEPISPPTAQQDHSPRSSRRESRDDQGQLESRHDLHVWHSALIILLIAVLAAVVWSNVRATKQSSAPDQAWDQALARAAREVERVWGRMGL